MRRTLPGRDELDEIYAPEYFVADAEQPVDGYAEYFEDAARHRETARRRPARLDRFVPARGKLLDVGAAAGFFVDEARRAGWDAEGVDVAAHMVEWGQRQLGAPLHVGGVADIAGTYVAVTMWDYIEHSLEPAADPRPGARAAYSRRRRRPQYGRPRFTRRPRLGEALAPAHPRHHSFFFTASTLTRLLERSGFTSSGSAIQARATHSRISLTKGFLPRSASVSPARVSAG
jgi:hypothetical protein